MLRALLLLACTAKVAAFAQTPAGEAGCVDMDPDVIQSAFAEAIQDVEVEGVPTITSCADVAANGGCADEEVAASCCATCALPQRVTYSVHARVIPADVEVAIQLKVLHLERHRVEREMVAAARLERRVLARE